MQTLRDLLIQRAARLQERPALTAPGWGTLAWGAWRSRVEGVALGLLAEETPDRAVHCATGSAWDWAAEVAAACCGLRWDPAGGCIDAALLGGARFNADAGRAPYHRREQAITAATPFLPGLDHGELLLRLRRLNGRLGWDHHTELCIPVTALPFARAALWSLLYAGGHAVLTKAGPGGFDPEPYQSLFLA